MVAENFVPAMACVYVHEGKSYENVPGDPGGPTKAGVIQRRYDQYRIAEGRPKQSVALMTDDECTEIYRRYYAKAVRFDDLPAGTDYAVLDGAINSGPQQAGKWLQRAINDMRAATGDGPIVVDGSIGDGTVQALLAIEDQDKLIALVQAKRLAMLQNLTTYKLFGKGWARRVREVQAAAQAVARGGVSLPLNPTWAKAGGKAFVSDAKPIPSPAKGAVAGFVGTVTSATGAVTPQLQPLQGMSPHLDAVLQGLVIVGVLAAAGGALWAVYARSKAKARIEALDLGVPQGAAS